MSVSKWAYDPRYCDDGGCPGDCDLCNKPKNMEDEQTDYVKREDAIERLKYHTDFYQNDREFGSEEMLYKDSALNEISELPSADVVEVVRCKDCKLATKDKVLIDRYNCYVHDEQTRANDFCSYGERADT